ncbi:MAG: 23S rRNA (pseudouridine(1915)-N(3))-methyltransferase RlmH [Pseudomonadota bacterium]
MRIHLIAVGTRMPAWIATGYQDYARRLPRECSLQLVEIATGRRGGSGNAERARTAEGRHMLAAVPRDCHVIALDVTGQAWNTEVLAGRLQGWLGAGRDVALLVGGPDGLAPACLARADTRWSLSPLTLPHALVRVVLAEQLYRAWTLVSGHPYHRA